VVLVALWATKKAPAPAPVASSKGAQKAVEEAGKGKPAQEGAKGGVQPATTEVVEAKPPETTSKMGRPDYLPPARAGAAPDPFAPLSRQGAGALTAPSGAPTQPGPATYVSMPENLPPPTVGQPFVSAGGVQPSPLVAVKPVSVKPRAANFFDSLGPDWPYSPARPAVPSTGTSLVLLGTVLGDRPCAIVWDGSRSRIVGEGDSLSIRGHRFTFREIGNGYAQIVYDHQSRTLKMREGT